MPFASRRQQKAMFGGHIPGMSKRDAHRWADETPDMKALPDRAPAEKGKPTLRSKKANGDMLAYFLEHPDKAKAYFDRKEAKEKRAALEALEPVFVDMFKAAALGAAVSKPSMVGKLTGMMTTHALKAPGYAASTNALKPGKSIVSAMNVAKPH